MFIKFWSEGAFLLIDYKSDSLIFYILPDI